MEKLMPPPTVGMLLMLVRAGHVEQLELLRAVHPEPFLTCLNQEARDGMNPRAPLHVAVEDGKAALVELLLNWGANPLLQLSNGDTALTLACSRNRLAEARMLLARGANPNVPGSYGVPALWNACLMGSLDLINALLDANADVNMTCARGTPLQAACLRAAPDVLHRILVAGGRSDPGVPTSALLLPWRNVSLLRRLMERGVRVSVDLDGAPLALIHSITEMAKDPDSYLCVMGKDALDMFLPYVVDMQLRAADRAQRMKRDFMQREEERRKAELTAERPRRTGLDIPDFGADGVGIHAQNGDGDQDDEDMGDNDNDNDEDEEEDEDEDEEEEDKDKKGKAKRRGAIDKRRVLKLRPRRKAAQVAKGKVRTPLTRARGYRRRGR